MVKQVRKNQLPQNLERNFLLPSVFLVFLFKRLSKYNLTPFDVARSLFTSLGLYGIKLKQVNLPLDRLVHLLVRYQEHQKVSLRPQIGFCSGVPVHKGITIVRSFFRSHWLAVVYCVVYCMGSCEPVHEDRTAERNSTENALSRKLVENSTFILNLIGQCAWWPNCVLYGNARPEMAGELVNNGKHNMKFI